MEELFTGAFKALVGLGGGGWIVSGLFLLGIVYLYRENNRIRDRAEAIGERTVLALERVGAANANVATTLEGSTRSREEMIRLLAEVARRSEADGTRNAEETAGIIRELRSLNEAFRAAEKDAARVFSEHKDMLDAIRANHMEILKGRGAFPANHNPGS